jgi:TrmH family RNA methyltransferase
MIDADRLAALPVGARRRKLASAFAAVERALASPAGTPASAVDLAALARLCSLCDADGGLDHGECRTHESGARRARELALALFSRGGADRAEGCERGDLIRALNSARHSLLKAAGAEVGDWDLVDPATGALDGRARRSSPGVILFLDDVRSPFNVGSIFRAAESFGVGRILLSPGCADPTHPRAHRTAMGAVDAVPWSRAPLEEALGDPARPAFALETGGTELARFGFPAEGVAVIGSEELGVSPEALARCALGRATIPTWGAKGSLNVAVATGIMLERWAESRFPCGQAAHSL